MSKPCHHEVKVVFPPTTLATTHRDTETSGNRPERARCSGQCAQCAHRRTKTQSR